MQGFFQVLVGGLGNGCIYGLVALSFVLIYKTTRAMSFMQGDLLMFGAFSVVGLHQGLGWPFWAALLAGVGATALLGALFERGVLRFARNDPSMLAVVLLTFGLGMMLRGSVAAVPQAGYGMFRLPLADEGAVLSVAGLTLPLSHLLVVLATAIITLALALFFRYTRYGIALRACASDARAAALMGLPVGNLHTLAWALGALLAALAGVLLAPITFAHLDMGNIALKAFPAAVLGGVTSLPGALLAGVLLGVVEALAGLFLPVGVKDVVPYALLITALLLFPQGLAGWRRTA